MPSIPYNPTREALYKPQVGPTVFAGGPVAEAYRAAEFARLAYKKFDHADALEREGQKDAVRRALALVGFGRCEFFDRNGSQAFATIDDVSSAVVVAYRGTEADPTDFATDLETWSVTWEGQGKVHAGFHAALNNIWSEVEAWIQHHPGAVTFTGHSLGAALATLSAARWQQAQLITFGCPLVGDAVFARSMAAVRATRFVNCCDVVCRIPPEVLGFVHPFPAEYIDRDGLRRGNLGASDVHQDREAARESYMVDYAWRIGNVALRELADHAPINYVRALGA